MVIFELNLPNDSKFIFGCIYITPTATIKMYAKHCDLLKSIALQHIVSWKHLCESPSLLPMQN